MSFAEYITKAVISGIVGVSSIFNPLISENVPKTPPAPQPPQQKAVNQIKVQIENQLKEIKPPQESPVIINVPPKKNNSKRKLNVVTIPKAEPLKELPRILPLKEILDRTKSAPLPQKTNIIATPEKSVFDIINTIPTLNTQPVVKTINPLEKIKGSLANIYCKTQNGNTVSLVTGSAVMINSHGVALTNAHVAQYPLIEKYFKGTQNGAQSKTMNCYGRIGSPANGTYKIDVLYISPNWIKKNARNIIDPNFTETGEDDIAVVRFIATNNAPFAFTNISETNLQTNSKIYIASYPASEIRQNGLNASLYSQYEENFIRQIDYYNQSKPMIETNTSSLGQSGSSGGGFFDSNGNLFGTIALVVQSSTANNPYIRGLSISHINKTLSESGMSLKQYIENNPDIIESNFHKTATELGTILIQTISSSQ